MPQVTETGALFTEEVLGGNGDVFKRQLRGVLRLKADFLQRPRLGVPLHTVLDDEEGNTGAALFRVSNGHDNREVCLDAIGDECLGTIHDVVAVGVFLSERPDSRQVSAGPRLRHSNSGDLLTSTKRT